MRMTIAEIENYLNSFPPGYKFDPSDDELITEYLLPKINEKELPINLMHDVNIYSHNPDNLAEMYSAQGNKGWYFFTSRDKKYRNGTRPSRKAGDGYWKATGADKAIQRDGIEIGARKALVFYKGRPPKGEKTLWIMHEFRVAGPSQVKKRKHSDVDDNTSMRLDDHILCRIYKKNELGPKDKSPREEGEEEIENESFESQVDEPIEGESPSKESSPAIDDINSSSNTYNTSIDPCYNVNVYTMEDNSGIPNVNTYGARNNNNGNHNVKLYGCPNVNKYNNKVSTNGILNFNALDNVNTSSNLDIHNVNVYPTSHSCEDFHSVQPLIGSFPTSQLMASASISSMNASYARLLDWNPYQTFGNYSFSEDFNGDFNNDDDPSILHLLLDPQNSAMGDLDPDPMSMISVCHEAVNMSNPPQPPAEEIEVKDVLPLPPPPLHTPPRSLPR